MYSVWLNHFYVSWKGGVLRGVLSRGLQQLWSQEFCGSLSYDFDKEIDFQEWGE